MTYKIYDCYGYSIRNFAELSRAFPQQFVREEVRFRAWPDGWQALVRSVCQLAHDSGLLVEWTEIKEYSGGLRMLTGTGVMGVGPYADNGERSQALDDARRKFNSLLLEVLMRSRSTCMSCGGAGRAVHFQGHQVIACESCLPPPFNGVSYESLEGFEEE